MAQENLVAQLYKMFWKEPHSSFWITKPTDRDNTCITVLGTSREYYDIKMTVIAGDGSYFEVEVREYHEEDTPAGFEIRYSDINSKLENESPMSEWGTIVESWEAAADLIDKGFAYMGRADLAMLHLLRRIGKDGVQNEYLVYP